MAVAGRAKGELYEDEGEGFAYKKGDYLLTHYEAALELTKGGEEVVVRISKSEGQHQRPKRTLCVRLLVGDTTEVLFPASSVLSILAIVWQFFVGFLSLTGNVGC